MAKELGGTVDRRSGLSILVPVLLVAYGIIVFRNAWLSEDAYITYRTVDNFLHGYGLTWNVAERVQAYTHPLWMLLHAVCYAFTQEIYFTGLAISIVASLCAVSLGALRLPTSAASAVVGVSILLFSKAFVDYSTSGLENPLTHLILVIFLLVYFRPGPVNGRRLSLLSLFAALGTLSRMDTLLFFIPLLLESLWQLRGRRALLAVAFGFVPLVLWEMFSLLYYGFPFPNTAYAKLNTGIPASELLAQGIAYLQDSLIQDRVTLPAILGALTAATVMRRRELLPLAIGILLYLGYVVKIGGDFMSGRFLAAPLLCAVVVVWRLQFSTKSAWLALGLVLVAGVLSPDPPPLSGKDYGLDAAIEREKGEPDHLFERSHGIADERELYYPATGLLRAFRARESGSPWPDHAWATAGRNHRGKGRIIHVNSSIGLLGFFAGPVPHFIDPPALADPLLARLPAAKHWRIGHFFRVVPNGYVETIVSGRNEICDEKLAQYYERLSLVTRGKLFDRSRLVAIWELNTGQHEHLIDRTLYRRLPSSHNDKGLTEYTVEELDAFFQEDPNDPYAHYKAGIAHAKRGNLDQALIHWEAARRADPDDRCVRQDLARAYEIKRSLSSKDPIP
jgi:arabinofuranosyltransferase